jgi:hypothetical protein
MRRPHLLAVPTTVLLAGSLSLAACSSTVTGSGSGSLAAVASATSSSAPSSVSAAPTTSLSPTASRTPPTSSAPASKTSSAPLGPATLLSMTITPPNCGASTDDKDITLSWTSKNATEVWIEDSAVALGLTGADPKSDGNGTKLTNVSLSRGSLPISFPCSDTTDTAHYYLLEFYNTANTTMDGQIQQVPRG